MQTLKIEAFKLTTGPWNYFLWICWSLAQKRLGTPGLCHLRMCGMAIHNQW